MHKRYAGHILKFIKEKRWIVIAVIVAGAILLWGPTIYANLSTRGSRYDINKTSINNVPKHKVAIVFGAGVYADGTPTPYLRWRVQTAVKLYKAGRVQKLLMSGDNSTVKYDEPVAMKKLAVSLGVKPFDIVLDYAGYSTYDTCYRAHIIFKLKDATLVSQGYHLPRAVMTCDSIGVHSMGVDAVNQGKDWTVSYIMREWLSTDKAVVQNISKPKPTLLGSPLPIL